MLRCVVWHAGVSVVTVRRRLGLSKAAARAAPGHLFHALPVAPPGSVTAAATTVVVLPNGWRLEWSLRSAAERDQLLAFVASFLATAGAGIAQRSGALPCQIYAIVAFLFVPNGIMHLHA